MDDPSNRTPLRFPDFDAARPYIALTDEYLAAGIETKAHSATPFADFRRALAARR
ncbi:MAG TPA: hypothetical protein VGK37_00975 [Casimicrobiaceae bacterium]